jgi:NAD(P)-dependent dehydrogenase (short-subunit alcohol dehydrogenase family)
VKLLGPKAHALKVEITDSAARKAAFKEAGEKFGKLDILFANAGIPGTTPAGKTSEELFRQIIDINLTSVFFTVEDALPYLNDGASVILNGSVIGTLGQPGYAAYAATKAGVRALARSLAGDLSPRGIRVNVVAPGATKTPIWSRNTARTEEQVTGIQEQFSKLIALGRMGEAEEIAKAVLFLASDDSSYVQGVELFVDGGLTGTPFGGPGARG